MEYFFKPIAFKFLKKLPKNIQKIIIEKLDFYAKSVNPLKYSEPLNDKDLGDFRFRIGEWRVIFDIENNKIIILLIGHRKNIYK
jgi:mRNA interferase RelE/StbE